MYKHCRALLKLAYHKSKMTVKNNQGICESNISSPEGERSLNTARHPDNVINLERLEHRVAQLIKDCGMQFYSRDGNGGKLKKKPERMGSGPSAAPSGVQGQRPWWGSGSKAP